MQEILVVNNNEWILEELSNPSQLLQPIIEAQATRDDASHCLWLVQGSGPDHELSVHLAGDNDDFVQPQVLYINENEEIPTAMFRLSHIRQGKGTHDDDDDEKKQAQVQVQHVQLPDTTTDDDNVPQVGTKLLLEDSLVKIWEFRIAPQASCAFHCHVHPYFFINLSESLTQELDSEGITVPNKLPNLQTKGQCTFVPKKDLSCHGVRNVGTKTFLQFVVEFVQHDT